MDAARRKGWLGFAAVLLLATGVRWWGLGDRVLWFDEAVSVLIAKAPARAALVAAQDDTHPPLYYLALHYWQALFPGEGGARALSVVAGSLTVAVVFGLGRAVAGPAAGWWSAGLLAVSPLHVWYSQEVRMYALQTLLVSVSWWCLVRAVANARGLAWAGYAGSTALALYTQYSTVFSLLAQVVFVAWRHRAAGRSFALAVAGVAVLFAPWGGMFWRHWHGQAFGSWLRPFEWADPLRFFALLSGAVQKQATPYWPWTVVTGLALAGAARRAGPWWAWLLLPVAVLTALSVEHNVFLPRALVFVTPAFALLVGGAAATGDRWARRGLALVLAANVGALVVYHRQPNAMTQSALRVAAEMVLANAQPGDVVVHTSRFTYRPFQVYAGGLRQGLTAETEAMPALFQVIGESRLPADWAQARRVWLVTCADFQRRDAARDAGAMLAPQRRERRRVLADGWMQVELYGLIDGGQPPTVAPNGGSK